MTDELKEKEKRVRAYFEATLPAANIPIDKALKMSMGNMAQTHSVLSVGSGIGTALIASKFVKVGKDTLTARREAAKKRNEEFKAKHPIWQAHANEYWREHPTADIRATARHIASLTDDSFETIRKNIRKVG